MENREQKWRTKNGKRITKHGEPSKKKAKRLICFDKKDDTRFFLHIVFLL